MEEQKKKHFSKCDDVIATVCEAKLMMMKAEISLCHRREKTD